MANTTNFGWETPDDTDLVKDGAAAIRTLGSSIDTSFVDLKGGTTGQILSKASNTDLDYTWINNDQGDITAVNTTAPLQGGGTTGSLTLSVDAGSTTTSGVVQLEDSISSTSTTKAATPNSVKTAYDLANGAIAKSIVDAKGDIIAATADNTVSRLAVGANNTVLTADSSTATGLKWATPSAGGLTLISTTTLSGTTTTVSSISQSYRNLYMVFRDFYPSTNGSRFRFRFNGSTTNLDYNYQPSGPNYFEFPTSTPSNGTNGQNGFASLLVQDYANTVCWKNWQAAQTTTQQTDDGNYVGNTTLNFAWTNTSAIDSITIFASSGNINGTMLLYGVS